MKLGNIHKSKECIFEMTSDDGGRLETLHWSNPIQKSFVSDFNNFVIIDSIHKTNIYYMSLVVTNIVDSLGKSVPFVFLLAPSEHSDSITRHMNILKLIRSNFIDLSLFNTRSIINYEGSVSVEVAPDMTGYHHCFFSISSYITLYKMYVVII